MLVALRFETCTKCLNHVVFASYSYSCSSLSPSSSAAAVVPTHCNLNSLKAY